uniref:Uncharacterized protein n=1 Tax=Chromera velia CCMP2878 TaxID=1169474 RepID=A0A0G4HFB0_9ALVE|eukprot:Cvel_6609.t1-p1 / transcript=Cvel_6609.t1 / gene=Cvel_6609 / organism=Chromera_velia_CCMP2878 / gene_product=hypothetical protein / transcript_product=hypothetical protein / location=Cvel_scaffold327:11181-14899(-) / protein_length=105 / sequence_SO=supercontig / SO=protein_coding / is_pseudo=false
MPKECFSFLLACSSSREIRRVVAGGQHESLERLLLDIQTEAFERLKVLDAECIREEKEVEEKNALLTSSLRPDLEALDHFIAYMEFALYAREEEFKRLKVGTCIV